MKLTEITDSNAGFFKNVIGERYDGKRENELFTGVIDDRGEAVAAAIFLEEEERLMLDFIGVSAARRRQGIGSFLIREMKGAAKKAGFGAISLVLYRNEKDPGWEGLENFLLKNGFIFEEMEAKRSVYSLPEVLKAMPFSESPIKRPFRIKAPFELTDKDREGLLNLKEPLIDPEKIMAQENRYGGVALEKDGIRAALTCELFADGIRLGSLYGDGDGLRMFPWLFDHAGEMIRQEGMELNRLYIDTAGAKTAEYENRFLAKAGLAPIEEYPGMAASLTV